MVSVRPAEAIDVPRVAAVATAAFAAYTERIGRVPWPALEDHAARVAAGLTWVAVEDAGGTGEDVVGYCVLVEHEDHLELDAVAVDPGRQGTGAGRALVTYAEARAAERGFAEVRLSTNVVMTENRTLYPHLGYRETGRGQVHGYDRVFYAKSLTSAGP